MTAGVDEASLRHEICRVGRSLYERRYAHASAGNISVRLPSEGDRAGGFLITPTDACLGTLQPERLARVEPDGKQTSGDRASKTLLLHQRIYAADADAACIVHTHSHNLVALTLQRVWHHDDIVPPITPYFVMKVGHVPLIDYRLPGHPEVADAVVLRIAAMQRRGTPIRAVVLQRLGPVVWHRTPAEASAVLEELEETAALWRGCEPKPEPLSDEQIDALRQRFGVAW